MLNGSRAPVRRRPRRNGRAAPVPKPPRIEPDFDAETLAVARALLEGIAGALSGQDEAGPAGPPTPVQLKDLATAARTAQAVGRLALGAEDGDAPAAAARAVASLLAEIDGGSRGLPDGG